MKIIYSHTGSSVKEDGTIYVGFPDDCRYSAETEPRRAGHYSLGSEIHWLHPGPLLHLGTGRTFYTCGLEPG